jgi:hypothetical protein
MVVNAAVQRTLLRIMKQHLCFEDPMLLMMTLRKEEKVVWVTSPVCSVFRFYLWDRTALTLKNPRPLLYELFSHEKRGDMMV